jgi:hypothetical protein
MKSLGTNVFTGFQEPPIDFPPTFKYDVLRTLKGSKRVRARARIRGKILSEVEESAHLEAESMMELNPKGNTIADDDDSSSTSSASISMQSRSAADNDDEASLNGSDAGAKNGASAVGSPDPGKTVKHAAHHAKRKWWVLFRSTVSLSAVEQVPSKNETHKKKSPSIASKPGSIGPASMQDKVPTTPVQPETPMRASIFTKSDLTLDNKPLKSPQPPANVRATTSLDIPVRPSSEIQSSIAMARSTTTKSSSSVPAISKTLIGDASLDIEDKGVYDTSSKRRVPSW